VFLTKIYVNGLPHVTGNVTTGENGFDNFPKAMEESLPAAWAQGGG